MASSFAIDCSPAIAPMFVVVAPGLGMGLTTFGGRVPMAPILFVLLRF